MFVQRRDYGTEIFIFIGVLLLESSSDRAHLRLRLGQRHAGFEFCKNLEIVAVSTSNLFGSESNRHPNLIVTRRKLEPRRHDADDGVDFSVQSQRLANNSGVTAKSAMP